MTMNPLAATSYALAESGDTYRLVVGFESLKDLQAAHAFVIKAARAPSHAEGALTDAAEVKRLMERLRASAEEVESFPHPSSCDHLHVAFKVMREAADALDRLASRPAPAAVPEGLVLVPVEPTQAMVHAGIHASKANTMDVWRAMLAAATQPQGAGKEST